MEGEIVRRRLRGKVGRDGDGWRAYHLCIWPKKVGEAAVERSEQRP